MARRVAIDDYRAERIRPRPANLEDWQDAADRVRQSGTPGFDDGVATADLLDTLAPERRAAFVLTQILGLSYQEAAQVCRCPLGTLRSRIVRAREDLIALLREDEDTSRERSTG